METVVNIARTETLCVVEIRFEEHRMVIDFIDGNELSVPLAWFPKLYYATPKQQSRWRIMGHGLVIRWPELDEAVSIEDLLR